MPDLWANLCYSRRTIAFRLRRLASMSDQSRIVDRYPARELDQAGILGPGVHARLAALGILLVICYWPMLSFTAKVLVESEDMAHGFFAPIVAGLFIWRRKGRMTTLLGSPSRWGLPVLALAGVCGIVGALGSSSTASRVAFLGSVAGAVLLVGGYELLRQCAFPMLLLLYTFPMPAVLYGEVTMPLQLLASSLSEISLETLGYSVLREGNILQLPYHRLSVVEACSGIRSLLTLSFFCLVYGVAFESKSSMRVLLVAASIPAAVLVNMMRITITGMLGEVGPEWTRGLAHDVLGWTVLIVGFGLVVAAQLLLRRIWKERSPCG